MKLIYVKKEREFGMGEPDFFFNAVHRALLRRRSLGLVSQEKWEVCYPKKGYDININNNKKQYRHTSVLPVTHKIFSTNKKASVAIIKQHLWSIKKITLLLLEAFPLFYLFIFV